MFNRMMFFFTVMIEVYRVIIACGLVIFVPQVCYGNNYCQTEGERTSCSISTNINFNCLKPYNVFIILFNIFTAILFSILYVIEVKRDSWILRHFERDIDKSEMNLNLFKEQYAKLFQKLLNYNRLYFVCYQIMLVIYILNSGFSLVLFGLLYYDITTITFYLSSILLCSRKIYLGYTLAERSVRINIPICYFDRDFIAYNVIELHTQIIYNTPIRRKSDIGPFVSVKKIIRNSITSSKTNSSVNLVELYNTSIEELGNLSLAELGLIPIEDDMITGEQLQI